MTFLHNNKTWKILELIQNWNTSSYWADWVDWYVAREIEWKLKPLSLEDVTFDINWVKWKLFKFTIKERVEIAQADKVIIDWNEYKVNQFKHYDWITFETTKILLSIK